MKKLVIVALAFALSLGIAFAQRPANPGAGGQCVQAGLATLSEVASITAAAQKTIDYSGFAGDDGIRLPLETGSFLSLGAVVSLHATNPGAFAWCD